MKRRVFVASLAGLAVGSLWPAIGLTIYGRPGPIPGAWDYILPALRPIAYVTCPLAILFPPESPWTAAWQNALLYGFVAAACRNGTRTVLAGMSVAALFAAGAAVFCAALPQWRPDDYWTMGATLAVLGGALTRIWSTALPTLIGAAAGVLVAFGTIAAGYHPWFDILGTSRSQRLYVGAASLCAGLGWLLADLAHSWLKRRMTRGSVIVP